MLVLSAAARGRNHWAPGSKLRESKEIFLLILMSFRWSFKSETWQNLAVLIHILKPPELSVKTFRPVRQLRKQHCTQRMRKSGNSSLQETGYSHNCRAFLRDKTQSSSKPIPHRPILELKKILLSNIYFNRCEHPDWWVCFCILT